MRNCQKGGYARTHFFFCFSCYLSFVFLESDPSMMITCRFDGGQTDRGNNI